jgi:hypothetical protein
MKYEWLPAVGKSSKTDYSREPAKRNTTLLMPCFFSSITLVLKNKITNFNWFELLSLW